MPLGFERLNERTQRPNAYINFIRPLPGPDQASAEDFLSRIAAQCYPVMKTHHISVMALEEHAPNPEFLGRNFNAGEVIQLVLKDRAGRWLSMRFVQMVMMHELAHCKQMNHSRRFWSVRDGYAQQMEALWRDGYVGEGMWGRGRGLASGSFVDAPPPDQTLMPEQLCGGSYRRRGPKRKRGVPGGERQPGLSYAERQQKRIQRKFGRHGDGESLGEDELVRGALSTMNGGKRAAAKPRVANSKRGRELRANAALLRFEAGKNQPQPEPTPEPAEDVDSGTDSEWEEESGSGSGRDCAVVSDGHGHDLVKVCGDGEDDAAGAAREMDELRTLSNGTAREQARTKRKDMVARHSATDGGADELPAPTRAQPKDKLGMCSTAAYPSRSKTPARGEEGHEDTAIPDDAASAHDCLACSACSLENAADAVTCTACANVLRPHVMPNHWRCGSNPCRASKYINAGDAGRCGLCGSPKPKAIPPHAPNRAASERSIGLTRPEVLRWD